ncbi:hypothetical protein F200043G1_39680 [[Clostridium] innocuum]
MYEKICATGIKDTLSVIEENENQVPDKGKAWAENCLHTQ